MWTSRRACFIPRGLGVAMAASGLAYGLVGFGGLLRPELRALLTSAPVSIAMLGELPFYGWLLLALRARQPWGSVRSSPG